MPLTPEQKLAANAVSHPSPGELSLVPGFKIVLPHGYAEVTLPDEDSRAHLGWVSIPREIKGHNTGSRLITIAVRECINRGYTDLVASALSPGGLRCVAKVLGPENLLFFDKEHGEGGDYQDLGWYQLPLNYDQAMQSIQMLADQQKTLIDAGREQDADSIDSFIRLAVRLDDPQVLDAFHNAERLYTPTDT